MAHLSGSGGMKIQSEYGIRDRVWTEELDCIPLKQRLKILLASKRLSDLTDAESEKGSNSPSIPPIDVAIKKEGQECDSQCHIKKGFNPDCFAEEERNRMLSPEQSYAGMLIDYNCQGTEGKEHVSSTGINTNEVNADTILVEKVNACSSTLTPCSMLSKYPVKAKVDSADSTLTSSLRNGVEDILGAKVQAVKVKTEIADDFADDLDHVVLKERRRLLLLRKSMELGEPVMEVAPSNCSWSLNPVVGDKIQHCIGKGNKENHSGDAEYLVARNRTQKVPERNSSDFRKTSKSGTSNAIIAGSSSQGTKSFNSGVTRVQENGSLCSSTKSFTTDESCGGQDFVSGNPPCLLSTALSSTFVNIKAESLDYGDVHRLEKDAVCNIPSNSAIPVKSELGIPESSNEDIVDHMLLRDRINMLTSRESPNLDSSRNLESSKKTLPPVVDYNHIASESAKPIKISRRRKKRKTATDSIETALEEDAPGLLKVLIDKGVSVNEIKLYGETESDEAIDESEESFSELEAVISKLFSQRQSQLKFPPLRCTKAERASYCLACLISLVEQARYLQFRKWPVEWGWCRDLQSFIFVFERHNRIVLERPEYGYATYFFELVDSLPIDWQIKRLVTAMKLTSCSRVTLIENKALMVGEDLTEGEARVLTEYGWVPNSGLGTMLNYCDRVVHDRKNERVDSSEWRSKIGKILVDGINCGTIVSTDIPKKAMGYSGGQGPQIKLEL